jgi:alkanesulfonate monooxygenase SsuD/methylene tetrahydromethanopterin reductase-like flavin-dependent oxidoreductase (luciferase family)
MQQPHPPLWVAVSSPETAIQAAERGIGMLGVSIGTPAEQEARVSEYHRIIQNCDPVGAFVNAQANNLNWLYVDEDRDRGHKMGERLIASFNELATKTVGINQVYPAHAYNTPGLLFALRRDSMAGAKALIKDGFCIGTPDDVIASLRRWESIGCDGLMFLVNSKQTIPQERVLDSLRLFAEEVMPKFKDPVTLDLTRPGIVTTRTAAMATANGNGQTEPVAATPAP